MGAYSQEAPPVGPTLFPEWQQTWNATISDQYFDALYELSGSTNQQMADMNWSISASLVFSDTNDYEVAVVKDKWIIASSFGRNTILKVDTTANSGSLFTLSAGNTPGSRMRGGFAPSGSDSVVFRNNNGEFLRFNPDTNDAQLYTTSSNITVGPAGGTPDWNWEYFGALNQGSSNDINFSMKLDAADNLTIGHYKYTGSVNQEAAYLNPSNGKPSFVSYNNTTPNSEFDSSTREFFSTGSTLSATEELVTSEMLPYVNGGVRDGVQILLTNVKNGQTNNLYSYRNGNITAAASSTVGNPKPRTATIGPNGRMYYFSNTSNSLRAYDFTTNTEQEEFIGGASLSATDFNYRLVTAHNGAMYALPFINGDNVYRISLPLTGSDADNIYNMVHSPYYNKGK